MDNFYLTIIYIFRDVYYRYEAIDRIFKTYLSFLTPDDLNNLLVKSENMIKNLSLEARQRL